MKHHPNQIVIQRDNWNLYIFLTLYSGNIIYRNKIDTLIGIKHPGIILGNDYRGVTWVIHNHYGIGCPEIVTLEKFCAGSNYFFDSRPVFYNTIEIITRAIESWKEKKQYNWLLSNCQQFVNKITRNKNFSESIDEISNGALVTGSLIALFGLISGNKHMVNTGLTIGGVGIAGKAINN